VRESRTLRSTWRGLETWLGRNALTAVGAPVLDPTSDDAVEAWHAPATGERGAPPIYSAIAIETGLALRLVFHQPLRQTEGMLRSIAAVLGVDSPSQITRL
jgi:hypothetical protein